jgi:RNA polymerase sigma-70 factor, ECF subfamily
MVAMYGVELRVRYRSLAALLGSVAATGHEVDRTPSPSICARWRQKLSPVVNKSADGVISFAKPRYGRRQITDTSPFASRLILGPSAGDRMRSMGRDFESSVLPHLDAAYNLARWLVRDPADAEDILQEAVLRALTYFTSFRGDNARGWFLQILRNAAYASMKPDRTVPLAVGDDATAANPEPSDPADDPERALLKASDRQSLDRLLAALPVELREAIVLRELEELSYKEIAQITQAPIGTVMSRLWRARQLLAAAAKHEAVP